MDDLLTIKQTCERLHLCQRVVYQLIRDRQLEAIRLSPRCWRVRPAAIDQFLARKTVPARTQK